AGQRVWQGVEVSMRHRADQNGLSPRSIDEQVSFHALAIGENDGSHHLALGLDSRERGSPRLDTAEDRESPQQRLIGARVNVVTESGTKLRLFDRHRNAPSPR